MKKLKKTNSTRKTPAIFFVLFISFLFLGFSDPITAHSGDDNYSYSWHDGDYYTMGGIGMGILSWIIGILILAVLVLLIIWLSREMQTKVKKK